MSRRLELRGGRHEIADGPCEGCGGERDAAGDWLCSGCDLELGADYSAGPPYSTGRWVRVARSRAECDEADERITVTRWAAAAAVARDRGRGMS